jgi:hypothetical protein
MDAIRRVLSRPEFEERPPVLIDVGASGAIHPDWAALAPYAVCIAFDPDQREMHYVEKSASGFRKLVVYPAILHDSVSGTAEFYLTASPYCSSTLRPLNEKLDAWAFYRLFDVAKRTQLPAVMLPRVLEEQKLEYVDWFKSDSQGMDLRLFKSLGDALIRRVLVAQFEPGIIEAYENEDALWEVLAFMRGRQFWMTTMTVRGSQRIGRLARQALPHVLQRAPHHLLRTAPGWAELTYLNTFDDAWSSRDLLLGWVVATVHQEYGFALELALKGMATSHDAVFDMLRRRTIGSLQRRSIGLPAKILAGRLRTLRPPFL